MQRSVFSCFFLFFTRPFDYVADVVRGFNCTLKTQQNCVKSLSIYSFPLSVTKISGSPILIIQVSNSTFSAFIESFRGEWWRTA